MKPRALLPSLFFLGLAAAGCDVDERTLEQLLEDRGGAPEPGGGPGQPPVVDPPGPRPDPRPPAPGGRCFGGGSGVGGSTGTSGGTAGASGGSAGTVGSTGGRGGSSGTAGAAGGTAGAAGGTAGAAGGTAGASGDEAGSAAPSLADPRPAPTCRPAEAWKRDAHARCASGGPGFGLVDLRLDQPCGGDLYASMSFQCCDQGAPPPPPPPEPRCFGAATGAAPGGMLACRPADAWKADAEKQCAASGLRLVDFKPTQPCPDGGFAGMQLECCGPGMTPPPPPTCPAPPPPPPPRACKADHLEQPGVCATEAELRDRAAAVCAGQMMTLTRASVGISCVAGGFQAVKFECCAPQPAPLPEPQPAPLPADAPTSVPTAGASPPIFVAPARRPLPPECGGAVPPSPPSTPPSAPGGMCVKASQGGETSCKDPGTWKTYAAEDCAGRGLALRELSLREPCGGENHRFVDYLCCTPSR